MGCVYLLRCEKTGKRYVGRTKKTADRRFLEHCKNARNGCQKLISREIRENGSESFVLTVLYESSSNEELNEKEREFISKFNTNVSNGGDGLNSTAGGQGTFGYRWSDESKNRKKVPFEGVLSDLINDARSHSFNELSKKYCVSTTVLGRWLSEFGIEKPAMRSSAKKIGNQFLNRWSCEQEQQLVDLYEQDKSYREIAEKLGRSETAVSVKVGRLKKVRDLKKRYVRSK